MKILSAFLVGLSLCFTGCRAFEENIEASENASSTRGLNEKQEKSVEDFAGGGQLNATEEEAMAESISGPGGLD